MIRQIYLITILSAILSSSSVLKAQPRLTSNTENVSFGQIEWKHPVTAEYVITNTGDSPLVLTQVEPDCACIVVNWTQDPIAPGEKGVLKVSFDAETLGRFRKSVAIYSNARPNVAFLHFEGEVVTKVKDHTQTHPYLIGRIRLDCDAIDFPDAHKGEHPVKEIHIVNLSPQAYEPVLMHLPPYMEMEAVPDVLQQGESGIIRLTLNTERLVDLGLTRTSVYLSRFMGDKVSDENEIPVSAILLPDFSHLTEQERDKAPVIRLSTTRVDMLSRLEKKKRVREDIVITNDGQSPLVINKIQTFHPAINISLKKSVLKPGESAKLHVTLVRRNLRKKRRHLRLLMITNDPIHPKVQIDVR